MATLAQHGPDGATVGDIARRAHVAPGTFYNHFDDISALVDTIVDELASGVEIARDQLLAVEHDAGARVVIGTKQLLDLAADDPDAARAFVSLLATVPAFRARVRATVRRAIDDGIDQQRLASRPSAITADAVIGAVTQWMRTRLAGERHPDDDQHSLSLVLHLAGLRQADIHGVVIKALGPPTRKGDV